MRGEYPDFTAVIAVSWELPPRARRILTVDALRTIKEGTTSACAENTETIAHNQPASWNYLRVRGEYPK